MKNEKITFDPTEKSHILQYGEYLKKMGWGGVCPFKLEKPYTSVPHMIEAKLARVFCQLVEENYVQ